MAVQKSNQVLRQVGCVVGDLLQAARSKDQVQILLVCGVRFVAVQPTQHIITIGIHGSSTCSGVARQHWIKTRQRAQGLAAEMRNRNGQRLEPGEIFMIVVLAHFYDLLSQIGGKLAQP